VQLRGTFGSEKGIQRLAQPEGYGTSLLANADFVAQVKPEVMTENRERLAGFEG
jgi:hypothetical protein